MSQADELLESLTATPAVTAGEGSREDHIVVGRDRVIVVPDALKEIGVQYDHNMETVTIDCPRYWDDIDMSLMKVYINYMRADGHMGMYLCEPVIINTGVGMSKQDETMSFDWTISNDVTCVQGTLSFMICIKKTDEDGNEVNHWNSKLNTDMFIAEGLKCQESVLHRFPDIITQLLQRMDAVEVEQQRWEGATEEDLDAWKEAMEKEYSDWTKANELSMSTWKTARDRDYSSWKTATYNELDSRMDDAEAKVTDEAIAAQINECLDTNEETQQVIHDSVTTYLEESTVLEEQVVNDVNDYLVANPVDGVVRTTENTLVNSKDGGLKLVHMDGNSEQKTYSGKQLYNINDKYYNFASSSDDWITLTLDNTSGSNIKYLGADAKPSVNIVAGKKYLCVCEIKSNSVDLFYAVSSATSSSTGQFDANFYLTGRSNGIYVSEITARNDLTNSVTMLRTIIGVNAGKSGTVTFRISVLEDTSVTADTFVYEPYIGGVEMEQGWFNLTTGEKAPTTNCVRSVGRIPCKEGDVIVVKNDAAPEYNVMYYNDNSYVSYADGVKCGASYVVPSGVNYFAPFLHNANGLSVETAGKISVTVNGKPIYIRPSVVAMIQGKFNGLAPVESSTSDIYSTPISCNPGDTISMTLGNSLLSANTVYMHFRNANGAHLGTTSSAVKNEPFVVTARDDAAYVVLGVFKGSGITPEAASAITLTINDKPVKLSSTPYKIPASPNPYYPQVIDNTGDSVEMMQGYWNTNTGDYALSSNYICSKNSIPCGNNDRVSFTCEYTSAIVIVYYNDNGLLSRDMVDKKLSHTFTVPSGAKYFKYYLREKDTVYDAPETVGKITLTINDKYVVSIKTHGKNFIPYPYAETTLTNAGITFTDNGDGTITANGTNNGTYNSVIYLTKTLSLKAGKYIISSDSDNAPNIAVVALIKGVYYQWTSGIAKEFELTEDVSNVTVYVQVQKGGTVSNYTFKPMIRRADITDDTYEPYTEHTEYILLDEPLRKVGDVEDRIVEVDDVWGVERKIKELLCDGINVKFVMYSDSTNDWRLFYHDDSDIKVHILDKGDRLDYGIMSTHHTVDGRHGVGEQANKTIRYGDKNPRIYIVDNDFSNETELNAYLVDNVFTVYAQLATPTFTPLDTESQKALNRLKTFNGATYIEVDSVVQPSGMEFEYGVSKDAAYTLETMGAQKNTAMGPGFMVKSHYIDWSIRLDEGLVWGYSSPGIYIYQEGYTAIGLAGFYTGHEDVNLIACSVDASSARIVLKAASAGTSGTARIDVLYVKN